MSRIVRPAAFLCALLVASCAGVRPSGDAAQGKPALVVLVAVDQLGAGLLDRWRPIHVDGLKRLATEGVVYDHAYQSHGLTETCPGHSTLLTGKTPGRTGTVGNSWYDAEAGQEVYCVASVNYADARGPKSRRVGPSNLIATTLGDWLKETSAGSRVVAVAGKDRAAITIGGHRADSVFWYEDDYGFTTFVAPGEDAQARLAPVAALNRKIQRDHVPPPLWNYVHAQCREFEATWQIGATTWRSTLPPTPPARPGESAQPARSLQIMDPLTIEAAEGLIDHYALGRRGVTDLLALSLSATDFVGHGYGTAGPEMCEQMHLLDALLGRLLRRIEKSGVDALVVLTADHGGSDFTERLAARGDANARRIDGRALLRGVNAQLRQTLGLSADALVSPDLVQLYAVGADGKRLDDAQRERVVRAALAILRSRPEVAEAFALQDLRERPPKDLPAAAMTLRDRFALSAMPGRSGDILVAYKPGLATEAPRITRYVEQHSGPYDADRRVPIIFWRAGGVAERREGSVNTVDIAPTLANAIGLRPPADLDGRCLDLTVLGLAPCGAGAAAAKP